MRTKHGELLEACQAGLDVRAVPQVWQRDLGAVVPDAALPLALGEAQAAIQVPQSHGEGLRCLHTELGWSLGLQPRAVSAWLQGLQMAAV